MQSSCHGKAALSGLVLLLITSYNIDSADGLSDSICNNIEAEWQTDEPRLNGAFPFYTLLVSCMGNLTLEGYSVDSCVNNGQDCGPPAADAFCNYLGLDGSAYDNQFTVTLPADSPTHAMTGEWCIQNGTYARLNDTSLQAISSYPGPFCTKLDSVLCYRSRNSSLAIFDAGQDKADDLLAPGPAPSISSIVVGNIANSVPSHNVTTSPEVIALTRNTSANTTAPTAQAG